MRCCMEIQVGSVWVGKSWEVQSRDLNLVFTQILVRTRGSRTPPHFERALPIPVAF